LLYGIVPPYLKPGRSERGRTRGTVCLLVLVRKTSSSTNAWVSLWTGNNDGQFSLTIIYLLFLELRTSESIMLGGGDGAMARDSVVSKVRIRSGGD
jgi:hypothetical protein